MLKKFSKREITLLYILFIFVICFAGGQFIIKPLLLQNQELKTKQMALQMEQSTAEINLNLLNTLKDRADKSKTELDSIISGFVGYIEDEDIDKMITSISNSNNVLGNEIIISPIIIPELLENNIYHAVKSVTYVFTGSDYNTQAFLNSIYNLPYIDILSFYSEYGKEETTHTINMNIYMLNK